MCLKFQQQLGAASVSKYERLRIMEKDGNTWSKTEQKRDRMEEETVTERCVHIPFTSWRNDRQPITRTGRAQQI